MFHTTTIKFTTWLESRANAIEDAILGVVGGNQNLGTAERQHLMSRNTTEFSNEVLEQLRNLGLISNIIDDNQERYSDIINSINRGITIGELIEKVKGPVLAPNAIIAPDHE